MDDVVGCPEWAACVLDVDKIDAWNYKNGEDSKDEHGDDTTWFEVNGCKDQVAEYNPNCDPV